MRHVLRAAVCLLATFPAFAQAPLTLQEAAAEALARNPVLAAAEASTGMARAAVTESRAAWLPRIDVSHTVARGNNPVFVFGSLLEQGRFGSANFDPAFLNDPSPLINQRLAVNARFAIFPLSITIA